MLSRIPFAVVVCLGLILTSLQPNYCQGQQVAPTINFTVVDHAFGDPPFGVSATSNSAGAWTYSVVSGPATMSGSTVTLTGIGPVTLQASQVANTGYTAGAQTATFTVAAGVPPITFTVADRAYSDLPFNVSATSKSTSPPTYSVVSGPATMSGNTVTLTGIGQVVLQASLVADTNYTAGTQNATFAVAAGAPVITVTAGNHTFGDGPFPVTATSKSGGQFTYSVVSGPAAIAGGTNVVTLSGAGTVVLQAAQAANGSYAAGSQTATIVVTPAQPPCANCYASIGAGSVLSSTKFGDYNNLSNILQTTHLGTSTPQYAVGLAYRLPIYGPLWKLPLLSCDRDAYTAQYPEAKAAYCFPLKAFISFKFTPDASQTFNGFTFGLSHTLAFYQVSLLDLMVGVSYTAFNEVSPGFQQAAINVVSVQQAANNPYYAQYNLATLKTNGPTAYDGFPVQLLKADGTTGPLIYGASPLVSHYHSGLFIGVSVPVSLKSFLGAK
jgi:hypothetical protein